VPSEVAGIGTAVVAVVFVEAVAMSRVAETVAAAVGLISCAN
jgi:hypothetical protein